MAEYVLENENWKAVVSSHGCELISMVKKDGGQEYIWCAKPNIWKRHAPVLFPLVGKYRDDTAVYRGQSYHMTQHGFARDMEFAVLRHTHNAVEMRLAASEASREKYPFDFVLVCGYVLEENCLRATWRVENPGEETMYFAIGGHPAFVSGGRKSHAGCTLRFDTGEPSLRYHLINDKGLWMPEELALHLDEENRVTITEDFFDRDALIVEGRQAQCVTLEDGGKPVVDVRFDAPLFGLWSAARADVPYVCIEPWYGRTDEADFTGELGQRAYDNALEPGAVFEASYEMRFY